MTNRTKLIGSIVVLVGVLTISTFYLMARTPAPQQSSTSVAPQAPTPDDSKKPLQVTWSATSVETIISPGESSSSDLTFISSRNLKDLTIQTSTSIAAL